MGPWMSQLVAFPDSRAVYPFQNTSAAPGASGPKKTLALVLRLCPVTVPPPK